MDRPPSAPRRPTTRTLHGHSVTDDFAWMRRLDDPELHSYLEAENAWTAARTAHLQELRDAIFDELSQVLPEDDVSAPWRQGGFDYLVRRRAGQQYRVHTRRPAGDLDASREQVVLDENALAEGEDYLDLGVCEVSPDGRLLAYSVDLDGSEVFTLRVRDLESGRDLADEITGTYYGFAWSADSASFFYTTLDDAYRPDTVRRHVLGTPTDDDAMVWHEADRRFELEIEPTRSGDLVLLQAYSRDTSETRLVPAHEPARAPVVVQPRQQGIEYHVDHQRGDDGGRLVMAVNDTGPEFRVVAMPVRAIDGADRSASWTELVAHQPQTRVSAVAAFAGHLVVTEREDGRVRLRILDDAGKTVRLVEPDTTGEIVHLGHNEEYDVARVRLVREGWVRPAADIDHDLDTGAETVVHVQQVLVRPGPDDYRCTVVHATATDGTQVPMSLVSRSDLPDDMARPCLLYGYGSYESSLDPEFWYRMRPLLDRGYLLAIAHPRGGGEGGRGWWLQGRLTSKRNTFEDFIACARYLIDSGRTRPELLAARGGSAGGLLMGAAMALAPELFRAVVAEVPFVDVVTTMLDDSLPLTVGEWDEWGDPHQPEHYAYMLSYSPYDNLPGARRPALLVTASRHDPRVSVHEPAKWVAKMRLADEAAGDVESRPLLLQTAMGAGAHTGPAGRYDAWRHEASMHAFVIDMLTPEN
ncbi:MAG: S9 family peptidase [Actinomycetes bacterium]